MKFENLFFAVSFATALYSCSNGNSKYSMDSESCTRTTRISVDTGGVTVTTTTTPCDKSDCPDKKCKATRFK